ncbi:MAG: DegV family protein [Wujia sp.]
MKYKIVGDSCCDFTAEDLRKEYMVNVPLTMTVGNVEVVDDETFEQEKYLRLVAQCPECPKSACPSPEAYMEAFEGATYVFVVTLSSKLSGSYNSAMLARQIYMEEHPDVKIHVFDSKSAAAAQHLICTKLEELILRELEYETIVNTVNAYIGSMTTIFVLDDLETMRKNGRISKVKAMAANVLNIKAILHGVDGEIQQLDQARGMNKALNKLLFHIEKAGYDNTRKVAITQCGSKERCMNVRKVMMERFGFKDVQVYDAGGISSTYESRGGVIVSF